MKIKLLFLFFFACSTIVFAQKKYIIGNVKDELNHNLQFTYIYNPRTEELTTTDISGNFIISAMPFDEIRIVKKGFERIVFRSTSDDFNKPKEIVLNRVPIDIEEVIIAFRPTGNLKKDLAYFKTNKEVDHLNKEMNSYMRGPVNEMIPQNKVPSSFEIRKPSDGQIPLLGINFGGSGGEGLLGLLAGSIVGKKKGNPPRNYVEKQDFYRRIKESVDLEYFSGFGVSEYDFDVFLSYVDQTNSLTKRFYRNFNKELIENELKVALKEYLKTHKVKSNG